MLTRWTLPPNRFRKAAPKAQYRGLGLGPLAAAVEWGFVIVSLAGLATPPLGGWKVLSDRFSGFNSTPGPLTKWGDV
jgi:hypothetical protein